MGYDMYVCNTEGVAMETNYEDDFYLRRSMFNQGPLREALREAGMGFWAVSEPKFPEYPGDEHFTPEGWEPIDAIGENYREQCQRVKSQTGDERPGIPLHKLCSNDGWWVTRVECATALQLWERAGEPVPEDFRDDVLPFLVQASKNGGFRVY